MENAHKLNEINQKLDKCACLYIESYQSLLTLRELLNKALDDGYLNLSKARSIVGCTSLSILQIPSELEAKVSIETNEKIDIVKTDDPSVDLEVPSIQFNLSVSNSDSKEIPLPSWFGVLTPLSLKTSQKSFCRSLNLATSICECQTRLNELGKVYQDLLSEKNKLMN
ncbi:coiled-coil domain-containing protein [Brachionus plicatilis]|uniref:Vacuolar ATPase assembly protein VMA22 n=1 Tax=Brachionus plicatilis TaxID=10195 RepID=A0A3M7T008_BRAPC|nr:coiled-coil domain-containing protein [Brachionus plicatilis]